MYLSYQAGKPGRGTVTIEFRTDLQAHSLITEREAVIEVVRDILQEARTKLTALLEQTNHETEKAHRLQFDSTGNRISTAPERTSPFGRESTGAERGEDQASGVIASTDPTSSGRDGGS